MDLILLLEDGSIFQGQSFGFQKEIVGEIVFNTGMTGYQEILTDPSYYGQIVTMTYPLIGNYGINNFDYESLKPHVKGFIVREYCEYPSNFRCDKTINDYLIKYEIPGIAGLDTRALTKILREKGTMRGIIIQKTKFILKEALQKITKYKIINPVPEVTTKNIEVYGKGKKNIALIDYGVKKNIVKQLMSKGFRVTVFPSKSTYDEILKYKPNGIMLSNGPGDPKDCKIEISNIQTFVGKLPIFAICLGHQLMVLANGGDTTRLKYGHRGCNHPVKELKSGRTYITSQNHGYTVVEDSLDKEKLEVTHINMNDSTIEGVKFKNLPIFTVQFHPEASPGPQDTGYLFDDFLQMINSFEKGEYNAKR